MSDNQKKFIRTFADDEAAVKAGRVPELHQIDGTAPKITPVPPSPAVPEPSLPPAPPPTAPEPPPPKPLAPAPTIDEGLHIDRETPSATSRTSPIHKVPPPEKTSAPQWSSPIETYQSDFNDRVKTTGASTATILASAADAGQAVTAEPVKSRVGSVIAAVASIVLIVGGGIGVYFAYTRYVQVQTPVVITPAYTAPIFVDDPEEIPDATKDGIRTGVMASLAKALPTHSVRLLYTNLSTTTGSDLFTAMGLGAPSIVTRNVISKRSMAGLINSGERTSPFFILSVTSFADTFGGMLGWEGTMPSDMAFLYPAYPTMAIPAVAMGTTTATTSAIKGKSKSSTTTVAVALPQVKYEQPGFRDESVSNHDVRTYRDESGRALIVYGYWNRQTLVIARDPAAFADVVTRLQTAAAN